MPVRANNYFLGKGAPTATAQSWPGCPCGGLRPAPVVLCAEGVVNDGGGLKVGTGVLAGAAFVAAGAEFKGAPTSISQRWPGSP
jgi:hypothetical protein